MPVQCVCKRMNPPIELKLELEHSKEKTPKKEKEMKSLANGKKNQVTGKFSISKIKKFHF